MSYVEDPESMSLEERMVRSECEGCEQELHYSKLRMEELRREIDGLLDTLTLRETEVADLDRLATAQALAIGILESKIKRLEELVGRYATFVEAETARNMGLPMNRVSDFYAEHYAHGERCRAYEIARDALNPEHPQP